MSSISKMKGLCAAFATSVFMLFPATATATAMADEPQSDPTDLVDTFGDLVAGGSPVQQLADSLRDGGFTVVGAGTIMGQRGPAGHLSVFANDENEWRIVRMNTRFTTATVINQGRGFSLINYRYNVRINYDQNTDDAALVPAQSRGGGGGDNCMPESQFGRQVLKEQFSPGYLLQGYDAGNDIMKLFVNENGGFIGTTIKQDRLRTTCPVIGGEGFRVDTDFITQPQLR